ncbi:hypothetical protein H6F86_05400 [Phormidium sp. FACHB-592]|uniref:Uncharacterized protein n=1 Tax=Stenomitos frigidus AS-A4 TaxID=2933935 RepID=A0ABV0KTQ8_9CYAN|nr:hypothetical protein [Phormidium sp. FACHB-592]MBD2073328.1 hypothetical protein [Phormidium sp. FACHB-592]
MNSLTIDNPSLKPCQPESVTPSSKARGSMAKWFTIDNKLVCHWFPAES